MFLSSICSPRPSQHIPGFEISKTELAEQKEIKMNRTSDIGHLDGLAHEVWKDARQRNTQTCLVEAASESIAHRD